MRARVVRLLATSVVGACVAAGCVTAPAVGPGPAAPVVESSGAVVMGRVLDLVGKPAAGVLVRAYPVPAGQMVAAGAGNLIGNDAGSLIGNDAGALIGNDAGSLRRHVLQAPAEVRTDADGRFGLPVAGGQAVNVEAVLSDGVKAIALGAAAGRPLELKLAPTGTLAGRVRASDAQVTNLEGVDVFVPGTGYLAKADQAGDFTIPYVAAGTFQVVATKAGLGRARADGVAAVSNAITSVPALVLAPVVPRVTALSAPVGAAGTALVLTGEDLGASEGAPFQVTVGGAVAADPRRLDDRTIALTVPGGAASGDVVVTVGGVASAGRPFKVVKTLSLAGNGATVALGGPRTLAVEAEDAAGQPVANPPVTWAVVGAAARIEADGRLVPLAEGEVTVRATLGALEAEHELRVVRSGAVVSTIARSAEGGALTGAYSLAVAPDGTAYVQSDAERIMVVKPTGEVSTLVDYGVLGDFWALARDADGTLYVADPDRHRIARVDAAGRVTTLAGDPSSAGAEDGPAASATFDFPAGLTLIGRTLYVTDMGAVRAIDLGAPGMPVTTVVGAPHQSFRFKDPTAIAGTATTLYVADEHRIYQVALGATQAPTVLAGAPMSGYADGVGQAARFNVVAGLVVKDGRLYVADKDNHKLRVVRLDTGAVSTLAGGEPGHADGAGPVAQFEDPAGVAFDAAGRLYVTEFVGHALRRVELVGEP